MAAKDSKANTIESPRLVTVSRTAELLAISERSAWRLISTGELRAIKLGRSTRVMVESIDRLVERGGAA
ncbi:MAG: helix-turn-helix domain-containing protein [Phycisphaerales bacterium]|nr:helix-turn-helix domain-containing protein [Phycisphaerales bacterium]